MTRPGWGSPASGNGARGRFRCVFGFAWGRRPLLPRISFPPRGNFYDFRNAPRATRGTPRAGTPRSRRGRPRSRHGGTGARAAQVWAVPMAGGGTAWYPRGVRSRRRAWRKQRRWNARGALVPFQTFIIESALFLIVFGRFLFPTLSQGFSSVCEARNRIVPNRAQRSRTTPSRVSRMKRITHHARHTSHAPPGGGA